MSHYDWLNKHWVTFAKKCGVQHAHEGSIVAHGDKCYQYKDGWAKVGIPFEHGAAIYLLSYYAPFNTQVRETPSGWVAPYQWVIDNYEKFANLLPKM